MSKTNVRVMLDEIERRNKLRKAYIAGIDTGLDVLTRDLDTSSEEAFRETVESRFEDFMEDLDDE